MAPRVTDAVATTPSAQGAHPGINNLMDEVMFERLQSIPNMPARPGDPHYVGQAQWDTLNGVLDLNSGKFDQGEKDINSAISDLGTEDKLIKGAEESGKTAGQDILNCDSKSAEDELTKTVKDLKGNYFNTEARNDYEDALKALKSNDPNAKWNAMMDIAKAEESLQNRQTRVETASKDLTNGSNDFNSGNFYQGEQEFHNAMGDLHGQKHCEPFPPYGPPREFPPYEQGPGGQWPGYGRWNQGPIMYPLNPLEGQVTLDGQNAPMPIEYNLSQAYAASGAPQLESSVQGQGSQYQGYPGTLDMGNTEQLYTA